MQPRDSWSPWLAAFREGGGHERSLVSKEVRKETRQGLLGISIIDLSAYFIALIFWLLR
jgi:hypothetical protein